MAIDIGIGAGITIGGGVSFGGSGGGGPALWGTSAWGDNNFTVNSISKSGGTAPNYTLTFNVSSYPASESALAGIGVGSVITVVHGTQVTAGDTFTTTGVFTATGTPGVYTVTTVYAGAGLGPFPGFSQVSISA